MNKENCNAIMRLLSDGQLDYLFISAGLVINGRYLYQGMNMMSEINDPESRLVEVVGKNIFSAGFKVLLENQK